MNKNQLLDEYNESSKIDVMLDNIARMLSRRKRFSHHRYEDILDQFRKSADKGYAIFNRDSDTIKVYIIFDKITKIDKSDETKLFSDDPNTYTIYVVNMASPKVIGIFDSINNSELVFIREVMIDRANHISNPQIVLLSDEQQDQVKQEYNIVANNLPEIKHGTDALARYYQLAKGEIFEIVTPSETSGYSIEYRICK